MLVKDALTGIDHNVTISREQVILGKLYFASFYMQNASLSASLKSIILLQDKMRIFDVLLTEHKSMKYNYLQAVDKDGMPRYKLETDRGGSKWFSKVIKDPKVTSWKDEIVSFVLLVEHFLGYLLSINCFSSVC